MKGKGTNNSTCNMFNVLFASPNQPRRLASGVRRSAFGVLFLSSGGKAIWKGEMVGLHREAVVVFSFLSWVAGVSIWSGRLISLRLFGAGGTA